MQAAELGNKSQENPIGTTLLRVNYHFHWQMSYKLAEPMP